MGSERGWTDRELDSLAAAGFRFASLGDRILRTETACTAAVTLALAALGFV
ncbi:MAG: RsmE family RNA methyltransferase [Candidatus Moduliflexus flocculans]|nr:RsmE family RNA methyltransferase [Candidatus Moduliflexus flocculans]